MSNGKQSYGTDPSEYPVSEPVPKIDGLVQTSGKVWVCVWGGSH